GAYPWSLKTRIASDMGHLSNVQALGLVNEFAGENLHTLFLSHLSGENNSPELALETFRTLQNRYVIHSTSRYEAGNVYRF
nr:MBL fold metallo-hydrolase [Prolixibacteraceae bacterium]